MIPNQPGTRKIFGLDLLRVVAILLVLAAHILWIYPEYSNVFTRILGFVGFAGVEIFFVLSGFLIGNSLLRVYLPGNYSLVTALHFTARRLWRILPSYWLIFLLNLLLALTLGMDVEQPWRYLFFIQNLEGPMLPFFPESWSMSIKELPYLIIPFMLLLFARNSKGAFLLVVLTIASLSFVAKIIFHIHNGGVPLAWWNISLRSVALFRLDAVMTGVLLAYMQNCFVRIWPKQTVWCALLGILVFGFLGFVIGVLKWQTPDYPLFWNVLFLPLLTLSCSLVLPWFNCWEFAPQWLSWPVREIGKISYMIYLCHYSLVLFSMKLLIDTQKLTLIEKHLFTIAYLAVTFAVSYALYRWYERPIAKAYAATRAQKQDIRA